MKELAYDLHIHSCLSPCGDNDMTPYNIVAMAKLKGLDVIALTDHNTCKNLLPFMKHGTDIGIITIPGMELTTIEEVHVLIFFYDLESAMKFDDYVYKRLPYIKNKEVIFGQQMMVDECDNEVGREEKLLINATEISYFQLEDILKEYHGVMVPAHVNKGSNSLISNLGFIPKDVKVKALEVVKPYNLDTLFFQNEDMTQCHIMHNSDAHSLYHIKERGDVIWVNEPTIKDILDLLS